VGWSWAGSVRRVTVPARDAASVPDVDAALADLQSLDTRPLEEHVAVYESAHGSLVRALDTSGGSRSSSQVS